MGTTIVLASLIVIMNLISDIMYKIVDPRINLDRWDEPSGDAYKSISLRNRQLTRIYQN